MARLTLPQSARPRRRLDSRLIVGALVIAASIAAGYFVVTSATRTTDLYVTRVAVVAGTALSEANLTRKPANLADASGAYLAAGDLVEGSIATRTLGAGEFVPQSAVGRVSAVTTTRMVVDVSSGLPEDTTPGTAVDVWATLTDPFGEQPSSSFVVVPGATFVRVVTSDALASDATMRAELQIPRSSLRSLLAAQGDGARIVVVPTVSQAG